MAVQTVEANPTAGIELTLELSDPQGEVSAYAVDSVPDGSQIAIGLIATGNDEDTDVGAGAAVEGTTTLGRNISTATPFLTPDLPGEYTITGYDFRLGAGVPSFPGDPTGDRKTVLLRKETSTIHVGQDIYLEIRTLHGDGGRLKLTVVDSTIRAASIVDEVNERSAAAALQTTVTTALSALVGQATATVGTDLVTGVNELLAAYEVHRVDIGGGSPVHLAADNVNTVVGRTATASQYQAIALLNSLKGIIVEHMLDSENAGTWHTANDTKNVPAVGTAGTLEQATVLLTDLRERVYVRHAAQVASPAVHSNPDTTPTPPLTTAASLLDNLIVAYLDALVDENLSHVAGEPEGILDAISLHGFRTS